MTPAHRNLMLGPLLSLACLPLAASAAQLKVLNDAGTAVNSSVELSSVNFEPGNKRLVVSTVAGNTDCGVETALSAGQLGLVVDDGTPRTYALRTDPLPAGRSPIEYLTSTKDFEVILPSTVGTECKSNNITSYKLQFDQGRLLSIAEQVYFRLDTKTFEIRINEPVLCFSYATVGAPLKISLTSPADPLAEVLPGFTALDYKLGGKVLNALSAGDTQCLDFVVTQSSQQSSKFSADLVFSASFEDNDVEADLVVTAKALSGSDNISLVADGPKTFDYEVEVQNIGNGAATGVRVRELVPSGVARLNDSSSWECTRFASPSDVVGTSCGTGNHAKLDVDGGSVAPGESLVYTLHRRVNGGTVGDVYTLGAAAFVNPHGGQGSRPERDYFDNSDPVTVTLVGNQSTAFASSPVVVAYEDGDSANPQDPTTISAGQTIALSFVDNDSSTVTITGVTTNGGAGLPASLSAPAVTGTAPNFAALLAVPATGKDQSGPVTITLAVNDGSTTANLNFSFDVLARNDSPVFNLSTTNIAVPTCSGTCAETQILNFVTDKAAGPATALDEASQTTSATTDGAGRITCQNPPSGFFTFDQNPQLIANGGNYNLVFRAGGIAGTVTCEVTLVDSAAPQQGSTTKTFTVSYTSPPPTIAGVPTSTVALNEDNGAPQPADVILTISDPNGLQAGSPSISSNTPSLLDATLVPTGSPNEWRVTFAPVANKNGNGVVFTVSATDTQGSTATATFNADVGAVNDAPSFTLNVPSSTIAVTLGDPSCGASGSCIASASDFVTNRQPGPAAATDETAQMVRPNTVNDGFGDARLVAGACRAAPTGGIDPATFFVDGALPRVTEPTAGTFNLIASLTRTVGAVECDITVIDNGSPTATSPVQTVTISYQTP